MSDDSQELHACTEHGLLDIDTVTHLPRNVQEVQHAREQALWMQEATPDVHLWNEMEWQNDPRLVKRSLTEALVPEALPDELRTVQWISMQELLVTQDIGAMLHQVMTKNLRDAAATDDSCSACLARRRKCSFVTGQGNSQQDAKQRTVRRVNQAN